MTTEPNGHSKGFAFVEFENEVVRYPAYLALEIDIFRV